MKNIKSLKSVISLSLLTALSLVGCSSINSKEQSNISTKTLTATTENNKQTNTISENSPELAQVSYSFGFIMGESNKETVNDLDLTAFYQGFQDAYQNKEATLSKEQMQKVLLAYQQRKETEYAREIETLAEINLAKGKQFLSENAKKSGIKTTASGLQYEIIKEGKGETPKASDTVKVNYEGKLIDGTIFDSSYERGEAVALPLTQVIVGWTEGLQLMKTGAKYRFYIPADLAYGSAGVSGIEPNSVLIFDVELLEINPK